ncbi:hypothetical protein DL767_001529 [Monosporascus sp. MG133]|nr:hypothetical protein DL767_001529 [Monosporascus sp. MG133]
MTLMLRPHHFNIYTLTDYDKTWHNEHSLPFSKVESYRIRLFAQSRDGVCIRLRSDVIPTPIRSDPLYLPAATAGIPPETPSISETPRLPCTNQLLASASAAAPTPTPALTLAPSPSPVPPPTFTTTINESGGQRVHGGDPPPLGDKDRDPAHRLAQDCRGCGPTVDSALCSSFNSYHHAWAQSATGQVAACGMETSMADEFFTLLKEHNARTAEDAGAEVNNTPVLSNFDDAMDRTRGPSPPNSGNARGFPGIVRALLTDERVNENVNGGPPLAQFCQVLALGLSPVPGIPFLTKIAGRKTMWYMAIFSSGTFCIPAGFARSLAWHFKAVLGRVFNGGVQEEEKAKENEDEKKTENA